MPATNDKYLHSASPLELWVPVSSVGKVGSRAALTGKCTKHVTSGSKIVGIGFSLFANLYHFPSAPVL